MAKKQKKADVGPLRYYRANQMGYGPAGGVGGPHKLILGPMETKGEGEMFFFEGEEQEDGTFVFPKRGSWMDPVNEDGSPRELLEDEEIPDVQAAILNLENASKIGQAPFVRLDPETLSELARLTASEDKAAIERLTAENAQLKADADAAKNKGGGKGKDSTLLT